MNYTIEYILNNIVFACAKGTDLGSSERQSLEGVHAVLCVKEILKMINDQNISLVESDRPFFENHDQGKDIVVRWADLNGLDSDKEVDISVGVADVLVYGEDLGIFEIGTTRPTKMLLLLKYISKQNTCYTIHFWPYGSKKAIIFKNWT